MLLVQRKVDINKNIFMLVIIGELEKFSLNQKMKLN